MSLNLQELQDATAKWRDRNFPGHTAEDQILGMTEELGELCHSYLKNKQGIRGDAPQHFADMADAVGDLVIYLAGFCSTMNLDLNDCVLMAWAEVKNRDWIADPQAGGG